MPAPHTHWDEGDHEWFDWDYDPVRQMWFRRCTHAGCGVKQVSLHRPD